MVDKGRTDKKIFESKPEGSRRGRPRVRWLVDVEKDLGEMKVNRRRQKEVEREEWTAVIKVAVRGPWSQGVSK
jgi:hypothetical protein